MSKQEIKWLIGFVMAFIGAIIAVYVAINAHERDTCRTFCEDYGETAYYSSEYGCFCVTPDGHRYNPDMLTKEQ